MGRMDEEESVLCSLICCFTTAQISLQARAPEWLSLYLNFGRGQLLVLSPLRVVLVPTGTGPAPSGPRPSQPDRAEFWKDDTPILRRSSSANTVLVRSLDLHLNPL